MTDSGLSWCKYFLPVFDIDFDQLSSVYDGCILLIVIVSAYELYWV